jgi:hypothetical protein
MRDTDMMVKMTCRVQTISNNRSELIIRLQRDTGSGFANLPGAYASDYVARDSDQNTGGVTLEWWFDANSPTDKFRIQVEGDCLGTCTLDAGNTWITFENLAGMPA